jgi:nucleotide-binding universal stress UspA family protein
MPTIGYTRFRLLLLGSVTASVLHDAECPVLTDAHTEEHPLAVPKYETILCALDLEHGSPELLRKAREFAAKMKARLIPVHAVPQPDERFITGPSERAHRYLCDEARKTYAQYGAPEELVVVEAPGSAIQGVVSAVREHRADLIIAGRGHAQGFLGRLRSNIHRLILESPCPVLSI